MLREKPILVIHLTGLYPYKTLTGIMAHAYVVKKNRALIDEFQRQHQDVIDWANRGKRPGQPIKDAFDPSSDIKWRRRLIREFIKTNLGSYTAYENACKALSAL